MKSGKYTLGFKTTLRGATKVRSCWSFLSDRNPKFDNFYSFGLWPWGCSLPLWPMKPQFLIWIVNAMICWNQSIYFHLLKSVNLWFVETSQFIFISCILILNVMICWNQSSSVDLLHSYLNCASLCSQVLVEFCWFIAFLS